MKLLTVWWFRRCDLQKVCNCHQNEIEIELWLEFWGPWIAKTLARAKVFDEIVYSANYDDAKKTALSRNPTATVISVTATFL